MPFLQLIRWRNLLLISFTQLLVYYCLDDGFHKHFPEKPIIFLVISTLCIAAGGYIINDYFDVKIDVINKPQKLVVDKFFSRRWTLVMHVSVTLIGMVLGFLVSPWFALINLVNASLLGLYSARFKYQLVIGNIVISLLMAASIAVVWFAEKEVQLEWLALYSGFAFLTGLVREILKDIEDMRGDEAFGCRTLPIVFGVFRTKQVVLALLLLICALLIGFLFLSWERGHILLALWMLFLVFIPLVYALIKLKKADKKIDFSSLSKLMKFIMLFGTVSMLFRLL